MDKRLKACSFSFYSTMAVIGPYFPLYFQQQGYTPMQLGVLYAIGPLMGIVSTVLSGVLSDRLQSVRTVLLFVLAGQLLCLCAVPAAGSYGVLVAVMLGFYLFQSPIIPLNDSVLLHHIKDHGGSYASYRVWASIGFASSVLLFGLLMNRFGLQLTPWLAVAAIAVSFVAASSLKIRQATDGGRPTTPVRDLFSGRFAMFLAIVFLLSIAHRLNDGFQSLYLGSIGGNEAYLGWSMLIASGCEIPVFFFLARFGHRFRHMALLTFASAIYAIRFLALSRIHEPVAAVALQTLHSLSFGIYIYAAVSYVLVIVPNEYRSTGLAIFAIVWSGFAGIAAGMIGGFLFDQFGAHAVYSAALAFAVAALAGFAIGCVPQARSLSRTAE